MSVYFSRDQVFGGGDEVVEDVLLFLQHAGAVPVFAKLAAAAQVGDGIDAAVLHPEIHAAVEAGAHGDVEAAVAREQRGIMAVLHQAFFADDEHRNLGAVFGVIPLLADVVLVRDRWKAHRPWPTARSCRSSDRSGRRTAAQ